MSRASRAALSGTRLAPNTRRLLPHKVLGLGGSPCLHYAAWPGADECRVCHAPARGSFAPELQRPSTHMGTPTAAYAKRLCVAARRGPQFVAQLRAARNQCDARAGHRGPDHWRSDGVDSVCRDRGASSAFASSRLEQVHLTPLVAPKVSAPARVELVLKCHANGTVRRVARWCEPHAPVLFPLRSLLPDTFYTFKFEVCRAPCQFRTDSK